MWCSFSHLARNITSTSNPEFILSQEDGVDDVLLGRCNHSSAFEVYQFFRLRNDTSYLMANSTNRSRFPNLLMEKASEQDQDGYYCALNYQGIRYISDKYVLTLKGNTFSFVKFQILIYAIFVLLIYLLSWSFIFLLKKSIYIKKVAMVITKLRTQHCLHNLFILT